MMEWAIATLVFATVAVLLTLIVVFRELRSLKRAQRGSPTWEGRSESLETLLAVLPFPVLVVDRDGACLEEFSPPDRLQGRETLARLPDDAHAALLQSVRLAIDEQRAQSVRFVLDERWYIADILPLPPDAYRPHTATVVLRDATSEMESADRAEQLATRNEAILRSAMDGFFVVGEDYCFLEVNEAFCRMTGYEADELLGKKISDLEANEPPTGLAASTHARTGLHHFATAHRHKDGHVIQLEISVIVLRDEGRKILVGFARDVTERVRAEAALCKSEKKYRDLVETSQDLIWSVDAEGRWTFVNQAAKRIYGYEPEEMLGRRFTEFMPPEQVAKDLAAFDRIKAGVPHFQYETRHLRRDGTPIVLSFNAIALHDEQGAVIGTTGTATDVTQRKQAESERLSLEKRMQETQKLESLGMLAGGVAHDFNNFLVGVLCNASLAMEALPENSNLRGHLHKIVNASRRASELTRQMLAYSGRATYDVQPLDVNELVREMSDFMRATLPRNVTLEIAVEENLPPIEADSGQFQQVIMNLLTNGAEAIGDGPGTVNVTTSLRTLTPDEITRHFADQNVGPGRHVCLTVRDTGCGMPPETLARIFDPFFTTKFTGRGLGLAAILGIVRAHRGAMKVESKPGEGTVFTVLIPAAEKTPAVPARDAKPRRLPAGATVLVIDDEEDIRDAVDAVLTSRGMRVLTADGGVAGLEIYKRRADEIDVILLDMTMPGMNGEAVLRELLEIRPDANVVLSSGYSEQEAAARFGDTRIAGFVHKPYTPDVLVEHVGSALQRHRRGNVALGRTERKPESQPG